MFLLLENVSRWWSSVWILLSKRSFSIHLENKYSFYFLFFLQIKLRLKNWLKKSTNFRSLKNINCIHKLWISQLLAFYASTAKRCHRDRWKEENGRRVLLLYVEFRETEGLWDQRFWLIKPVLRKFWISERKWCWVVISTIIIKCHYWFKKLNQIKRRRISLNLTITASKLLRSTIR